MTLSATLRKLAIILAAIALIASTLNLAAETVFTVSPGRTAQINAITRGPDGNLWFAEETGLKVGKITPAGVITEYPIPGARGLTGIAAGPDGNIWFTDELAAFVGHIDTNGGSFHLITLSRLSHPQGITAGPDGNMWFVDELQSVSLGQGFKVGKITMSGHVTEYATHVSAGFFSPYNYAYSAITTGPDGNLWFTNPQIAAQGRNFLGVMSTGGQILHAFNLADTPIAITSGPGGLLWVTETAHVASVSTNGTETEVALQRNFGYTGICTGPDGNVWFSAARSIGYVVPGTYALTQYRPVDYTSFLFVSGIITGADNALWITGSQTGAIGQINTAGQITNSYFVNAGSQITGDTLGPDGAVWGTGYLSNAVTRIDPQGAITTFPGVPGGTLSSYIVTGPDGNLWYTDQGTNSIAKMTTSGVITEYSVGQTFAGLWSIAVGPDNNLWFPEYATAYNNIVKITTNGVMTPYAIPTANAAAMYVIKGPDGNVWFTEGGAQQVGYIDPISGTIHECTFPGTNKNLTALVAGPDNNLWIQEATSYGAVAKYTTGCTLLAEYPVQFETLLNIRVGTDGALWMPQYYPNSVARITTSGIVSTVALTAPNSVPNDLAFGSDGKIYVAEYAAGAFGVMSAIGGTGNTVQATHGTQFNGAVANFVDGTPTATAGDFTASIDWGDGTRGSGTVSGATGGPFTVSGTHTYTNPGGYTLKVSLQDTVDTAIYQASPGLATVH